MENFFNYLSNRIFYTDNGSGKIILLIHGYLETSDIWISFAEKLARKYRVIAVDLPGHGRSDIFAEEHTMEFIATAIKELLAKIEAEKIIMAGHSLGGYVTISFAELFPEMLSGYSLFHSHPFADSKEAIKKRENEIRMVKTGGKEKFISGDIKMMYASSNLQKFSALVKRSEEIALTIPDDGITAVLRGMMSRPSRLPVMEQGRVPCLWILGAMDNYINCEQIRTRVRLPANAEVVVLKNSGHMGFIEEEEQSIKILDEFASRLK
jgi:pimeloyl-ACP methyl ester carboxylesterase